MLRKLRKSTTNPASTICEGNSRPSSARRNGDASAKVYDYLRQQILTGDLAPGTHLSHQSIASLMQTSNGPVISALRHLAYEGLVNHERGYGCRVCDWSR